MSAQPDTLSLPVKLSRETLAYWCDQLSKAAKLEGGLMDSESRHVALTRERRLIIEDIADDIRSKL